jgi:hypothetical protein
MEYQAIKDISVRVGANIIELKKGDTITLIEEINLSGDVLVKINGFITHRHSSFMDQFKRVIM